MLALCSKRLNVFEIILKMNRAFHWKRTPINTQLNLFVERFFLSSHSSIITIPNPPGLPIGEATSTVPKRWWFHFPSKTPNFLKSFSPIQTPNAPPPSCFFPRVPSLTTQSALTLMPLFPSHIIISHPNNKGETSSSSLLTLKNKTVSVDYQPSKGVVLPFSEHRL